MLFRLFHSESTQSNRRFCAKPEASVWGIRPISLARSTRFARTAYQRRPFLFLLLALALYCAPAAHGRWGTVLTIDGRTLEGHVRLDTNEIVLVNSSAGRTSVVNLTNVVELNMETSTAGGASVRPEQVPGVGWESEDIGRARTEGKTRWAGGLCELSSGGANVGGTNDSARYLYRAVSGETEMAVRLLRLSPRAKPASAGLMLRSSLKPDAAAVYFALSVGRGLVLQIRRAAGQKIELVHTDASPSTWLKLRRVGQLITAHKSTDGRRWTMVEKIEMQLPGDLYAGVAVTGLGEDVKSPEAQVHCSFDHLREAPYLEKDWFVPRVELSSGSIVMGRIERADTRRLSFKGVGGPAPISMQAVARIMFDWLPPGARLVRGRSGVVLPSGEFVEGQFESMEKNRLTISSVLFGRRTFDVNGEVTAILVRNEWATPPRWQLVTQDQSRWAGTALEIGRGEIAIWDDALGRRSFSLYDVRDVRLLRRDTPE